MWRRRSRSMLDLWLMVAACAWCLDIALSAVLNAGRFDLGFYAGRIFGLLATGFVLAMLLLESSRLYALLIKTHRSERRKTAELRRLSTLKTTLRVVGIDHRDRRLLRADAGELRAEVTPALLDHLVGCLGCALPSEVEGDLVG